MQGLFLNRKKAVQGGPRFPGWNENPPPPRKPPSGREDVKVKVLLVHPWRPSVYEAAGITVPPTGMLYLAAVLRKGGHQVVFQDQVLPGEPLELDGVGLVGITCYAPTYNLAVSLARQAREAGVPVVMGGPHVTFTYEEALETGAVDFVVRGEGEETLLELADFLSGKRNGGLGAIPGLVWRDGREGGIVVNPDRPPLEDLDSLPYPARELVDFSLYRTLTVAKKQAVSIVTSRGCPFRCSFCVVPNLPQKRWRARSVESVVAEMEAVRERFGFESFVFVDDNLTVDTGRLRDFCERILRKAAPFRWWCMSRADTLVKHPDLVDLMGRAGCVTVFLGLESGSDRVLAEYAKKEDVETGTRAVRALESRGIEAHASFILGSPGETREDVEATIEYALALDPAVVQFSILTPYPGTPLYEVLEEKLLTRNWDLFDAAHTVFRHDRIDPAELDRLLVKAYRKFYARPGRLWRNLRERGALKRAFRVIRFLSSNWGR